MTGAKSDENSSLTYPKHWVDVPAQIRALESRGLAIGDSQSAADRGCLGDSAVTAAVFAGGHAAFFLEDSGHVALVEETGFGRDVGKKLVCCFK